jgi:hypothetical protein
MTEIELTDEQRRALQADPGRPVGVVDPATQQQYVLLAREQYERVRPLLEQPAAEAANPPPGIAPQMLQSMQAYWRDLPKLLALKSQRRRWVAYHGQERIGFGKTQQELYQECFRRGLQREEFYVGFLELDPEHIPPWGTIECDGSLYEFNEEDESGPSRGVS